VLPLRRTVGFGAAVALAAGLFNVPSLFVVGIAVLALAAGAAGWVALAARTTRIHRERGPATAVEDQPYPLAFSIERGPVPVPGGRVLEPLLDAPLELADAGELIMAEVRFPRRGRRTLEPPTLELRDPLGIAARRVRGVREREVLVLPRTEPVVASETGGSEGGRGLGGAAGGGAGLETPTVDPEIDGLRPYREGTPATRIHWPSVARRGEMMELRLVAGADRVPLVALDSSHPASEEALDRAVRAAASVCLHLARAGGGCSLLLAGEERPIAVSPDLEAWPRALARLALVEASRTIPSVRRAALATAIFWVSARPAERTPKALGGLRASACTLVLPEGFANAPAEFTVAGCEGVRLRAPARRASARAA
jgi:uncharacterized protein (DUF58 family)